MRFHPLHSAALFTDLGLQHLSEKYEKEIKKKRKKKKKRRKRIKKKEDKKNNR